MFKKANRSKQKLRILLEGVSGTGKTYSGLIMAKEFGGKTAVIDTERGSASLYSTEFDFDVMELTEPFTPEKYIKAIALAESEGYSTIIIDSISHEWSGPGGCLDIQSGMGGRFTDWQKVSPRHQALVDKILNCKSHVICTARTKADWSIEKNEKGKSAPKKVGMKTEQRDGMDYEFTTVLRLNHAHFFDCSKDRTRIFDGVNDLLTASHAKSLIEWLNTGVDEVKAPLVVAPVVPVIDNTDYTHYEFKKGPYIGMALSKVDDEEYLKLLLDTQNVPKDLLFAINSRISNLQN